MSEIDFSNVCLKPDEIDMVLYHGDCIDGFASAFACYYYFKQKKDKKKKKIIYIPLQYQKPPPMVDGKNILMCDFSFKYSTLKNIFNNIFIKGKNKKLILI